MDGIIYKIEIGQKLYIGSTTQKLYKRQSNHNKDLERKNYKLQKCCKENDINKITLIEIEKVKVENKKELNIIEQKYINELQPTLNTYRSYRTEEEIKNRHKEYNENNKEKRKELEKKSNDKKKEKVNCEFCNKEMNKGNLSRHQKLFCKKNNN